jgi:N-sulfoglucosamine sulfohydrolase
MRHTLTISLLLVSLASLLVAATPPPASQTPQKPNLLFIIADDLGRTLGCYGDKTARTPHMDRLAAEGVRFDNGYVTMSSCSPSRGSMFTGLYPHQHGMVGLSHFGTEQLRDDVPRLPNELKKAGYTTALIGKSHFVPFEPFQFDFYNEDLDHVNQDRDVLWQNRKMEEFLGGLDGQRPFFLVMSYIDPHRGQSDDGNTYGPGKNLKFPRVKLGLPPDPTPPEKVQPMPFLGLDSPEIRGEQADYYGAVDRLDLGIGDLRARLEAKGLWAHTLVVLIGDNGPDVSRGKIAVYEPATRIPFLVSGPGAARGLVREEFVSTIDLFPTFLTAAGVPSPTVDPRQTGRALQPLLQPGAAPWRQQMFTEFITHVPWDFYPRYTVREGNLKLIHNLYGGERENPLNPNNYCFAWFESRKPQYEGTPIRAVYDRMENPPRVELYDLSKDPFEMNNLAENPEYRETAARLMGDIESWRQQTGDPFLDAAAREAQEKKGLDYKAKVQSKPKGKGKPKAKAH